MLRCKTTRGKSKKLQLASNSNCWSFSRRLQSLLPTLFPSGMIAQILTAPRLVTDCTTFSPSECDSPLNRRSRQRRSTAAAGWNEVISFAPLEITVFTQSIIDLLERFEWTLEFTGAGVKNEDKISSLSRPQIMESVMIPAKMRVSFWVSTAINCNDCFCKMWLYLDGSCNYLHSWV